MFFLNFNYHPYLYLLFDVQKEKKSQSKKLFETDLEKLKIS